MSYDETKTEEARILEAARRDPTLFAPVYEGYFDRIYAYCRYRVGEQEAEDVTSRVFVRALTGLAQYRGGSVAAWLFRIAHNCVVDTLRDRQPQISLDEAEIRVPAADSDILDFIEQAEQWETVQGLITTLSDEQIDLLTLKMVSGLNATEIANVVGKSAVAVRVELHRIIQRLRTHYRQVEKEGKP